VAEVLADTRTDVLVSYLPWARRRRPSTTRGGAQGRLRLRQLRAGVHRLEPGLEPRFAEARLPIIGDDIKSQVGATIVHRVLANLMRERGVRLDRTYQLNFGGNADFQNMLERERLESKKISKTQAVASQLDVPLEPGDIHIGPSDFVPWLTDRKWAYIRLEGTAFGGVPLNMEVKLEVWDSPNSPAW
jgi:myo-inositol-1-phosphate synthase